MGLHEELGAFKRARATSQAAARQRAALFILCGIDLADALGGSPQERERLAARLRRLIERERQRGIRRHWSYDLNRHIALKQAFDRLCGVARMRVHASVTDNASVLTSSDPAIGEDRSGTLCQQKPAPGAYR